MNIDTTINYCFAVKEDDILLKQKMFKMKIKDNGSSLLPLKDRSSDFLFLPSFYDGYEFLIRAEIIEKLIRINEELLKDEKVLVISSLWRSHAHQKAMLENKAIRLRNEFPEKSESQIQTIVSHFISAPDKSMHSTGGAVDALIFDKRTGKVMDFGANKGYEMELGVKCYPYHPDISETAITSRNLLIGAFEKENFTVSLKEFWHFDYGNSAWAASKGYDAAIYGPIFN